MKAVIAAVLVALVLSSSITVLAERSLCYTVLEDLAASERSSRYIGGWVFVGVGALVAVSGAIASVPLIGLGVGAAIGGGAALFFLIPSQAEREFAALEELPEADQDVRCDVMLSRIAESARRWRYYYAIGQGASALGSLVLGSFTGFLTAAGGSAYYLLFPSEEEQAYQHYLDLVAATP